MGWILAKLSSSVFKKWGAVMLWNVQSARCNLQSATPKHMLQPAGGARVALGQASFTRHPA